MYDDKQKLSSIEENNKSKKTIFVIVSIMVFLLVCFSTFVSYIKYQEKITKKSVINIDINGDGIPDINIDNNGDTICDINCDIDEDNIADYNFDYNSNMKAIFNIDINKDKKADYNLLSQDIDGDGECDINCDLNDNNTPTSNIDIDGDKIADLNIKLQNANKKNIDIDNDFIPDIDIDTNEDEVCDLNCSNNGKKPYFNIDVNKDGVAEVNIDTNNDKKADKKLINIDVDNDTICDINCDTDSDGFPNLNIDIDEDKICDINCDVNGDRIPEDKLLNNVIKVDKIIIKEDKDLYDVKISSTNKLSDQEKITSPWTSTFSFIIVNSSNSYKFYSLSWNNVINKLDKNIVKYEIFKNYSLYLKSVEMPTENTSLSNNMFIPSGSSVQYNVKISFPKTDKKKGTTINSDLFTGNLKLEIIK